MVEHYADADEMIYSLYREDQMCRYLRMKENLLKNQEKYMNDEDKALVLYCINGIKKALGNRTCAGYY